MRMIKLFILFLLTLVPFASAVFVQENFTISGEYTWTVPVGVNQITVKLLSAGGDGGNGSNAQCCGPTPAGPGGGGGGGAGSYGEKTITVTEGQTYLVNVGDKNNPTSFSGGSILLLINPGSAGQNGGVSRGDAPGVGGAGGTILNAGQFDLTIVGSRGRDGSAGFRAGCNSGQYAWAGNGGNGGNGSKTGPFGSAGTFHCNLGITAQGGNGTFGAGGGGGSGYGGKGGNGGLGQVSISYNAPITPVILPSQSCSNTDQIIFSLYTSNNSHVALWNNESANYKICYDKIFGVNYTGSNPQVCTGDNLVVKLSDNSNAHAGTNYNVNVCYGNLDCSIRTSCQADELTVAKLSGTTNAHVANASFNYPYSLCCSTAQDIGSFISARWEIGNIQVNNAGKYQNMQLVAQTNFSAGTKVMFEIFEEDGLLDDSIKTGINNLTGIVDANGKVNVSWFINDSDIESGDNIGEGNELEFYFKASGLGKEITSSNLITSKVINLNPNNCNVDLSGIVNGGIYLINSQINLSHTSSVASQTTWQIVESGLSYNSNSVVLNLNDSGQKTINLIVKINGCADQIRQTSILVIDSGNKQHLFVSKPFAGQVIHLGNKSSIQVDYSADGSYIINSNLAACAGTISCIAGNCPMNTSGAPNGCSNLPISNSPQPYNLINFTWKEITKDGEKNAFISGLGEVSGSKTLFSSSYSRKINDYAFKVTANYTQSGVSLQQNFVRNFTFGECIDRGYNYTLQNQGVLQSILGTTNYSSSLSNFNSQACRGIDGLAGNKDDCCPSGYTCSSNGCIPKSESAPIRCEDYTTQAECEADSLGLWRYQSSNQPNTCSNTGNSISTICGWTPGNGCGLKTVLNSETTETGSCFEQAKNITSCVNGYYQINVTAIPTSGLNSCLECQSGVYVAPCGRPAFELPVFGIWQLILSLVCILVIYLVIRRFY